MTEHKKCNLNIPKVVKLWTTDIPKAMGDKDVTTSDIAEHFKITLQEAYSRISKLRKWGMIKIINRKKPRRYIVTKWGKKFLEQKGIK